MLASFLRLVYEAAMTKRQPKAVSRPATLAAETVRALSSTLLLLGLIGDRRAR
jgi:hypothetical protein